MFVIYFGYVPIQGNDVGLVGHGTILDNIGDTVDVEGIISPLYNFKAVEG